jgi:predicted DCC family thiol-disulfide oxidoreductase YuxK/uncharacterized membrane protein YphA (DoxX/SURF4 family)
MRMDALAKRWDAYWFTPAPLADLAICRIAVVAYQLAVLLRADFFVWWVREVPAKPAFLYDPTPVLRLLLPPAAWGYRPSSDVLLAVYWITVAAGILALVGIKTRWSLLVFSLASAFMIALGQSFGDWHHDGLLQMTLLILALSPSGAVLSLDDLRQRLRAAAARRQVDGAPAIPGPDSPMARWPLLLVRWLYALIYLSGALAKLGYGGRAWVNGYTLQYYLSQDGLRWGSSLGVWLGQQHGLARLISWITVLFEGTFAAVLAVPGLAWIYIPAGVALHLGIYATMRAPFFEFIVIYAVFVPWVAAFERLSRWTGVARRRLLILFDGQCPLCIRSMTLLRYFDWLDALAVADLETHWARVARAHPEISLEDCRREMHVVLADGSVRTGFFAFREIVWYLPAWWPLLGLCYLPLASVIGPRLYRAVASRRARTERCAFDTCSLNSDRP